MARPRGRMVSVSPCRRLVVDLMHFSLKVPCVTMERRMNLARLVEARQACNPRPSWTALFIKASAIVASKVPEMRQSYMPLPWPHFYEHHKSIATIPVERQWGEEKVVLLARVRSPENRSLGQIDAILSEYKDGAMEQISSFRRDLRLAMLPGPLRRLFMWAALYLFGCQRSHNFGTFSVASVAAHGAGMLHIVPFLTSTLHYGLLDDKGCLDMRLTIDHRVLDGAAAARVLVALESVLATEILDEVHSLRFARKAA
jgi:hypothetical protein